MRHFILAMIAMLCVAQPAFAQGRERVFVDLGRWTIYELPQPRTCELRLSSGQGVALSYRKTGQSTARLQMSLSRRGSAGFGDIVFAFDDDEFSGNLIGRTSYAPMDGHQQIETAFRASRFLTLRHGDAEIARISLQTSSAAFRLLKQCAEIGRMGTGATDISRYYTAPTRPSPTPTVPSIAQSPPAANNSGTDPVPQDVGNWVRAKDLRARRFETRHWNGGTLRFTLNVNERGRAEDCQVDASSGSREFDSRVCRLLLRRARFEPATDSQGNRVAGRYSSSFQYRSPN